MNRTNIEVPEYTAADFLNTSQPYEFLYQFKDNKFLLRQLCERMKAQAGKLGVKAFMALWDAYCESLAPQQELKFGNVTAFEDQEMELFSGEYLCDEAGVFSRDKFGYEQPICRHPIMPVQRLCNIDSGEERLRLAYKKGKTWRSLIVEKVTLASSHSILQLAANGVMVNSENAKALSTYLLEMENLNYDYIPEEQSVNRLGWVGEHGFSPYVDGLVFDGEASFKHIFNSVHSNGGRQTWIDAMKSLRAEKGPGRLFLAASFASAILAPCGILPFFLHAWGGTEVGKTVGLMVAASVWASPKLGDYITTFNSTTVGQEMTAAFLNSLPMCVDELQIQSSAGVKDFDKIIYQLSEGVGKTRGARTGGLQRTNTWRNCIITNGEHPISNVYSGGGAVNRIIEFECSQKVFSDLVGLCAVIQENYGFAGCEFAKFLQEPGAVRVVNAVQKEFYHELLKYDSTEKQAAAASAILAADEFATMLFFEDGNALTVQDMSEIMAKKQEVDVNARAYDFLMELVVRNPNRFNPNDSGDYQGEVWGKVEGNTIFLIKSVFDRELNAAGFNGAAFLSWAKRKCLLTSDKGKRTKNVRINGSVTRCICIDNILERIGNGENSGAESVKTLQFQDVSEHQAIKDLFSVTDVTDVT